MKADKRLHLLKLLKRTAVIIDDTLHRYKTVIWPVIEYAFPLWQLSLTVDELRKLEAIQKRAIMISSGANDYKFYYSWHELEQVKNHLHTLIRNFCTKILQPNDFIKTVTMPRTGECLETPNC